MMSKNNLKIPRSN